MRLVTIIDVRPLPSAFYGWRAAWVDADCGGELMRSSSASSPLTSPSAVPGRRPAEGQAYWAESTSVAEDRIRALYCRFVGAGFGFYLVAMMPLIMASHARFDSWWTVLAITAVFVPGISLGALSFSPGRRAIRLRIAAAATSAGYILAVASAPFAWQGPPISPDMAWWLGLFPGVAAMAAVVVCRAWAGATYLAVATIGAVAIQTAIREPGSWAPLYSEASFSFVFCLAYIASAYMALRTGRIIDETTRISHQAAATAAAADARTVERERFDALVHDGVMSTLLSAARLGVTEEVSRQARLALRRFDGLESEAVDGEEFDRAATVAEIRNAATAADQRAVFVAEGQGGRCPGIVVRAVAAAAGEAVRNSVRHSGGARCSVRMSLSDDALSVTVSDDGVGFDMRMVPAHRLGIAVSIRGRMLQLPGGDAEIRSEPGRGTMVKLRWSRT